MKPITNESLPKVEAAKGVKKKRGRKMTIWIIAILLFCVILYFLLSWLLSKPNPYGDTINVSRPPDTVKVAPNNIMATTTEAGKPAQAVAQSENFEMLQINLEGSGANVFDFGEADIFALGNVASELYSTKEGDKSEIRAVISCQTNKRSYVEVEYYKSGEKNKSVIKDTYLGFNHILVIPDLDPDSVYRYSITAADLNQTAVYSDQYVFYTGAGNISLVDVLGSAVQKVFGWAVGR